MPIRITTNMLASQSLLALRHSLNRLSKTQAQLATGRRLTRLADDPEAAASGARLQSRLAAIEQYKRQANAATALLGTYDTLLAQLNEIGASAQELTLRGSNSIGPSASGLASEANLLLEELVELANRQVDGRYLLGGRETLTAPFSVTRNANGDIITVTVNPRGINGTITAQVSSSATVQTNLPGEGVLGPQIGPDFLPQLLIDLRDNLALGNSNAVSALINSFKTAQDRLQPLVAAVGSRLSLIKNVQELNRDEALLLQGTLSELLDADLARVTIELQRQEVVHEAALAATARTIGLSLVDFLR
ncbi:MAG: flagellar hook-associated protein FlgL [Candidatus Methylomirabilia bacterium]